MISGKKEAGRNHIMKDPKKALNLYFFDVFHVMCILFAGFERISKASTFEARGADGSQSRRVCGAHRGEQSGGQRPRLGGDVFGEAR